MDFSDRCSRNVLLSCDHGMMIVNRFDCNHDGVGHGQWLLDHGNVSTVEAFTCAQHLQNQRDPVIIDVGANIGTFSSLMARWFPQGKIYAFEPQQSVFQMFCGNMAINNFHNVVAYPMALGSQAQWITVEQPNYELNNDFGTFSLVENILPTLAGSVMVIEVRTLDSLVQDLKINKIDLIKIDAEGMDLDVLQGAHVCMNQHRPLIYIEHCDNRKSIYPLIQEFFGDLNYDMRLQQNNVLCIPQN